MNLLDLTTCLVNQTSWINDPQWIQAYCSVAGLIITGLGTIYIAASFKQQAKVNRQQLELNRLAVENNRREIRPYFKVNGFTWVHVDDQVVYSCNLFLTNAIAYEAHFDINETEGKYAPMYCAELSNVFVHTVSLETVFLVTFFKNDKAGNGITLLNLKYQDEEGRDYVQTLDFDGDELKVSVPRPPRRK